MGLIDTLKQFNPLRKIDEQVRYECLWNELEARAIFKALYPPDNFEYIKKYIEVTNKISMKLTEYTGNEEIVDLMKEQTNALLIALNEANCIGKRREYERSDTEIKETEETGTDEPQASKAD